MRGAGALKQRIALQRATTTANAFNEPVETWATFATVFASRRDASASETYRAAEIGARISARFTIRRSSDVADVTPRDRLTLGGRSFDITAVRTTPDNRWIEIDAVARADTEAESA